MITIRFIEQGIGIEAMAIAPNRSPHKFDSNLGVESVLAFKTKDVIVVADSNADSESLLAFKDKDNLNLADHNVQSETAMAHGSKSPNDFNVGVEAVCIHVHRVLHLTDIQIGIDGAATILGPWDAPTNFSQPTPPIVVDPGVGFTSFSDTWVQIYSDYNTQKETIALRLNGSPIVEIGCP